MTMGSPSLVRRTGGLGIQIPSIVIVNTVPFRVDMLYLDRR